VRKVVPKCSADVQKRLPTPSVGRRRRRDVVTSRRCFLQSIGAAFGAASISGAAQIATPILSRRPKVAAIFSEFRFRSHAFNFLENFFKPFLFNGKLTDPGVDVVSFYADQFPKDDMARDVSKSFGIPLFGSIDEALCVGGRELAVDAVLSIVEHGDYPTNDRAQKMYPRKKFFDEAVAVMRRSDRYVPFFNDKHLSYRWDWARDMVRTARQFGIPLMAGSSVPLAERRPAIEIPEDAEIAEAIAIHAGGVEVYDFHGLEVLQSFVESRSAGETGIGRVEFLDADAIWQAADEGRWSVALAEAAIAAELGDAARPNITRPKLPNDSATKDPRQLAITHGILITYTDGLRGAVLQVGHSSNRWNFACRLKQATPAPVGSNPEKDQLLATALFNGPWGNRCLFKALSHAVQHLFINGRPPYPVERTLLVSGALDAAMTSRQRKEPVETPELQFGYQSGDWREFRELGGSWKVITKETPENKDFRPGDAQFVH
jgi:hypothetical protein